MKKVILITGCSSGIGFSTASYLSRTHQVYASVRNLQSPGTRELEKLKLPNLHLIQLDVTREALVTSAIKRILSEQGRIDVLINNAGYGHLGAIEDFTIEEIKQQYDTNLFGAMRCINAVLPSMRQHHNGLIINIGSINGLVSFPLYGVYCSSKFALETLSEVLRFELQPFGIKTVIIEPGVFLTHFPQNRKLPIKHNHPLSPYKSWTNRFFGRLDSKATQLKKQKFHRQLDPIHVAHLIARIIEASKPKVRYRIGLDAHFFYWSRKLIPYPIWSRLINLGYHWH